MNWKDLRIGVKIGLGFLVMVILAGVIGLVAYMKMTQIQSETNKLSSEYIPAINESFLIEQSWLEIMKNLQAYDGTGDDYFIKKSKTKLARLNNALKSLVDITNKSERLKSSHESILNLKKHSDAYAELLNTYETQVKESSLHYSRLLSSLESYRSANRQGNITIENQVNELNALIFQARADENPRLLSTIDRNISSLKNEVKRLGKSGLQAALTEYSDAAGKYSLTFIEAKKTELSRMELESNIYWEVKGISDIGLDKVLATGVTTNETIRAQRIFLIFAIIIVLLLGVVLLIIIVQSIARPIEVGINMANRIAKGDLSQSIEVDRKDEVGLLINALNKVSQSLQSIIRHLMEYSDIIAESSEKLLKSADLISDGSREQAAAAEEISSSVEEMYANIQQNTDNARETEIISQSSAKEVNKSKESFRIATMSLQDIMNKVVVINDLSFQTNLLALNAAIEAARAGEHGKGFAVVAGEVKKLADRSKEAAGVINEVSNTTMIMSQNARTELEALVPEIEKTAILIQGIATAGVEQVSGIEQINSAMQQLNTVVQQNVQRSEELTGHSRELSKQAEELQSLISDFKLEE